MNNINKKFFNDVKHRFLPLLRSATEELEHEPNISDFEIKRELGIGSYGNVYLVNHKKTKAEYALKIINKLDQLNQQDKAYFNREVEIMYKLNHPNIIKLYSHFEDYNNCYIVMQYISNGSAYDLVKDVPDPKKTDEFALQSGLKTLDDLMFKESIKRYSIAFEQQFHFACFYAYIKIKEQEIKNIVLLAEMNSLEKDAGSKLKKGYIVPFDY